MEKRETYDDDGEASRLGRVTDFNYLGKCRQGRLPSRRDSPSQHSNGLGPLPRFLILIFPENK